MKRILFLGTILLLTLVMVIPASAGTGNGAPNGAHYNLNIIGVPQGKTADMTSGNRIFVPLWGSTTIWLKQGDTFAVLDANGTDKDGASFQLPNPDPLNTGTTSYSVWSRALGKPKGTSTTTTCFTDLTGTWCSVYQMILVRSKGQSKFTDVSKELLYVYADTNNDGKLERYPLFSDTLASYFWQYDNNGLKLAQLRFYEVSSTVP